MICDSFDASSMVKQFEAVQVPLHLFLWVEKERSY